MNAKTHASEVRMGKNIAYFWKIYSSFLIGGVLLELKGEEILKKKDRCIPNNVDGQVKDNNGWNVLFLKLRNTGRRSGIGD